MKTISDLLREADPLHDDMRRLDEERARLRQAAIRASSALAARPPTMLPPRRAAIAAVAGIVVAIAALGSHLWSGVGTTLQAAVRFEVRLAEEQAGPGLTRVSDGDRTIYLHDDIVVANDDIVQSRIVPGNNPDHFWVSVEFSRSGAAKVRRATTNHVGRPVAILIDGVVVLAPVIRSPIGASAVISGDFTQAEAERIANGITAQ